MKQNSHRVDDSWSWALVTWRFTILLSFLLYIFEIIHNKNFNREKEKEKHYGRAAIELQVQQGESELFL